MQNFGNNDIYTKNGLSKLGKINIDNDTWIGANVNIEDNSYIGERSVIGMGSHIVENSNLKSNMISFGNPCKEYKEICDNYETTVKIPGNEGKRTEDEIKHILVHLKQHQ